MRSRRPRALRGRHAISVVVAACLVGTLLGPIAPASASFTEIPVSTGAGSRDNPAIDGDRVVYEDDRAGNRDIRMWDAATGIDVALTTDPSDQTRPAISGDYVVYEDARRGTDETLKSIAVAGGTDVWAVGSGGTMMHSSDGGSTWAKTRPGTTQLADVTFASATHGWAVGDAGTILATTNGGVSWSPQVSGTSVALAAVEFVDASTGWAVGSGGTILATADGGSTWTPQTSGTTYPLTDVGFFGASAGWAVGGLGLILATIDGGSTWTPQASGTMSGLESVDALSASTAVAVGAGGTIRRTTNGGATWGAVISPSMMSLSDVRFASASTGWAVGLLGTILRSVDGGSTWATQTAPGSSSLEAVAATGTSVAWTSGSIGTVHRTADGGANWTSVLAGSDRDIYLYDLSNGIETRITNDPADQTDPDISGNYVVYQDDRRGNTDIRLYDIGTAWDILLTVSMANQSDPAVWYSLAPWTIRTVYQDDRNGGLDIYMYEFVGGVESRLTFDPANQSAPDIEDRTVVYADNRNSLLGGMTGVSFGTAANGWAVGDQGLSIATADGGVTWAGQSSGTTRTLHAVSFVDAANGWAVGDGGTIRATGSGGAAWAGQSSGTTRTLRGVSFANATNGWAVGDDGAIRATTNGGAAWAGQSSGTTRTLQAVTSVDANRAWAVGDAGTILATTDGGANWTPQTSGVSIALNGVSFADASNGWAVGDAGTILATTDGGANWVPQTSGVGMKLTGVSFADASNGWAVGWVGTALHTTDGGATWTKQTTASTALLSAVDAQSSVAACLTGTLGTVMTTGDGGANWVKRVDGPDLDVYRVDIGTLAETLVTPGRHDSTDPAIDGTRIAFADDRAGEWDVYVHDLYSMTETLATSPGSDQTKPAISGANVAYLDDRHGGSDVYLSVLAPRPTPTPGSGWFVQRGPVAGTDFNAVASRGATQVIAAGTDQTVVWSGDAGSTWATAFPPPAVSNAYVGLSFPGPNAYAVGEAGLYRGSGDGGRMWLGGSADLSGLAVKDMDFVDSSVGWVAIGDGRVGRTVDSGSSWTVSAVASSALNAVDFVNATTGWAAGDGGVIKRSANGGSTWTTQTSGTTETLNGLSFADANTGWAVGAGGRILATTDGGGTWTPQVSATALTLNAVASRSATEAIAVGEGGVLLETTNGGSTWTPANTGVTVSLRGVAIGEGGYAWVVGAQSTILVRKDGTPPTTTASGIPGGWASAPVTVTLSATDAGGSGVYRTFVQTSAAGPAVYASPVVLTAEGVHQLSWWSIDNAYNAETTSGATVRIDNGPPATTSNMDGVWRTTPQLVTLSASDGAGAGVANSFYRVGGGAVTTYLAPFTAPGPGDWTVEYWSTDVLGKGETTNTGYVRYDPTPPVTTSDAVPTYEITATVSLTATDPLSSVAQTYWRLDAGSVNTGTVAVTSVPGTHTLEYRSVDVLGNSETTKSAVFAVYPNLPPVTTVSGIPTGWATADVQFALAATDTPGVANTYYRVNAGATTTYSAPVTVTAEGTSTLEYWSVDTIGAVEATKSATIRIDKTAPTDPALGSVPATGTWSRMPTVTVSWAGATDAVSGLAGYSLAWNAGAPASPDASADVSASVSSTVTTPGTGTWFFGLRTLDVAGNVTAGTGIGPIQIDLVSPTSTATLDPAWSTVPRIVSVTATDAHSGVAARYYSTDGSYPSVPYGAPFAVSAQGTTTVKYLAVDSAGNTETVNAGVVRVDSVAPTTTSDITPAPRPGPVSVTLTRVDNASGVAATYYSTDGSVPTTAYAGTFQISAEGTTTVRYFSVDSAGNTETVRTEYVRIDNTDYLPPVNPTVASPSHVASAWSSDKTVDITWSGATDELSGVAGFSFSWSAVTSATPDTTIDSALDPGSTTSPALTDGDWWFNLATRDVAGHWAAPVHLGPFRIDTVPPSGTFALAGGASYATSRVVSADSSVTGAAQMRFDTGDGTGWSAWMPFAASTPLTLPDSDGPHSVWAHYIDAAGNALIALDSVIVDRAAPGVPVVSSPTHPSESTWYASASPAFSWVSTDALSGVSGYSLVFDAAPGTVPDMVADQTGATKTYAGVADGEWWFHVRARDTAGNWTGAAHRRVRIDTVAPVSACDASSAWRTSPLTVSITSTDTASGVASRRYSLNGAAAVTYAGPFSISAEGTTTIAYSAIDAAGNREATKTAMVRIDRVAPATGSNAVATYADSALITLAPADAGSGVARTWYRVDGGALTTYTAPIAVTGYGPHSLQFGSVDTVGNSEATKTVAFDVVYSDTVAPTTTDDAPAGWVAAPVTVTLTATDTAGPGQTVSGVASRRYSLDGGVAVTYAGPFSISAEGATTIAYSAIDAAGNREATKTATVRIDRVAPVTGSNAVATYFDSALITLAPADAGSGVAGTWYRLDGGVVATYTAPIAVTGYGARSLRFGSIDAVGNAEATKTAAFGIVYSDTVAPTTTDDAPVGWVSTPVTVTLAATDAAASGEVTSGVASVRYSVDGAPATTYTAPIAVAAEGTTTIAYSAIDAAGNREATKTATVRIDRVAPVTGSNAVATYFDSALITLAPVDAGSGVAGTWYRLDGGAITTYTAPVAVTGYGAHTLSYGSIDAVGNAEATKTVAFDVVYSDTVAPTTTDDAPAGWVSTPATVTLAATDAAASGEVTSGVASVRYSVDGAPATTYTAPIAVAAEGTTTIAYSAIDAAGNREATKTATVRIDRVAPVTGSNAVATYFDSALITLTPTDAGSGVSHTWYRLDGGVVATYTAPIAAAGYGAHTLSYGSIDAVGNSEATKTVAFDIVYSDTVAPTTTDDAPAGWVSTPATVTLAATDAAASGEVTSGVASVRYSLNGAAATTYTAPIAVTAEGLTTIAYSAIDAAGNREATKTATVRIDHTPPTTSSDALPSYADVALITLTPTDAGSGVSHTWYRLDGGVVATYTAPIAAAGYGAHAVTFGSADPAGNAEATKTAAFTIVPSTTSYQTLAGANRFASAVAVSQHFDATASTVIIATGRNWPDALGGAALAGAIDAPILLVDTDAIPPEVTAEITRLGATNAIILGGPAAVSTAAEVTLRGQLGSANVRRIAGADRYATAAAVASEAVAALGGAFDGTAFVATARNFPDALAASPLAAANGWPLYLSSGTDMSPATMQAMRDAGVTRVIVLGGTAVVSTGVQTALVAEFGAGNVDRLEGADRYGTATTIATYGVVSGGMRWDGLAMATGQSFPDALVGGAAIGRSGAVMLVTPTAYLHAAPRAALVADRDLIGNVHFLGGTSALSDDVRDAVRGVLR